MKHPVVTKILLVLVSILVASLVAEVFLRIAKPQIFEVHPKGMYISDPDVGYVLTPGFEGYMIRPEFNAHFSTNQSGLRGTELRPRQLNTFRILVLGDSQAWGFGVEDKATFAYLLETMLVEHHAELDIQVLNSGVPGYGTADQLAFLNSRGRALQPDLVIVQFLSVNDIEESRLPAYSWAEIRDGMLVSKIRVEEMPERPIFRRIQEWIKANSHFGRLLSERLGYMAMRAGLLGRVDQLWGEDFTEEDAQQTIELLIKIVRTSQKIGARTLLLYTTGQAHVIPETPGPLRSAAVVESAAKQANVHWINLTEHLRRRADRYELYYPQNGHWTSAGHRAVAQILSNKIADLDLI